MARVGILACWLAGMAACGRIGFDTRSTTGDAAGDAPAATSCPLVAPTCGPTGSASCCESPPIPGGMFYRSYDVGTDGANSDMGYPATISAFRLDKYEITVGRFRQFVNAGQGTQAKPPTAGAGAHAAVPNSGWDAAWNGNLVADTPALISALGCDVNYTTWTDAPGANENRPINCIDWYEAMAFCAWDGGFLPTEAEWNYAAAGGSEQRALPWSSPPSSLTNDDSTYASYFVDATKQCFGDMVNGCTFNDLEPVGRKPAGDGAWGQSDLAGNLWEWVLDWYASPYPTTTCDDCSNVTSGSLRVLRGGSFDDAAMYLRGAARYPVVPTARVSDVADFGVRCGRHL